MSPAGPLLIHGTVIAAGRSAVLIRGQSGAGKSDLALRCLHLPAGPHLPSPFLLVADDQVYLSADGDGLLASAPLQIRGKLEVRGVGIVNVEPCPPAHIRLVVDLAAADRIERYPQIETCEIHGIRLQRVWLNPFEASAPIKLLLSLNAIILRQLEAN